MNELIFDDPCLVFALHREAQAFYQEFRPQQRFTGAPCRARFCGPEWLSVLALETGVGPTLARSALDWILSKPMLEKVPYCPKLVISAGFAGALQEQHKVGDVFLATEIVDAEGQAWPTTWPGDLPPGDWRPPLHRGRVLSVDCLIGDPNEKRRLGQKHSAAAVDMESAIVARLCRKHEIRFGCVRVISDALITPLSPALVSLVAGGRVSPFRLMKTLVSKPASATELWRLARDTRKASAQLAKALGELLTLTLPWGAEL